MNWKQVQSTAIKAIGYESDTKTLGVEFCNGTTYHYFNVPSPIHEQFIGACSHGTFHHDQVKTKYRYRRVR